MIVHPIKPFYDTDSRILILGSFPSVMSRETGFFYGHPRNRFWALLAGLTGEETPESIADKKRFLKQHHIALWDVIASCDITGSSDASIKNVVPNDLSPILETAEIRRIYVNGGTASRLYEKYLYPLYERDWVKLPSTSPANAAWSLERLAGSWKRILEDLS